MSFTSKDSTNSTNLPGDKSHIVPMPGLSRQLYVSPEKEIEEIKSLRSLTGQMLWKLSWFLFYVLSACSVVIQERDA